MLEMLLARASAAAEQRRAQLVRGIAERAEAEGLNASEEDSGVVLTGRGLHLRSALDPALRWLTAAIR